MRIPVTSNIDKEEFKIGHQSECQRYIMKIHSSRLRNAKWKLTLPLDEAKRNDEIISLASSQVLRWIDELNGLSDADATAKQIKSKIKELKREKSSAVNRKKIRQLYSELDALQFKPDYMCLVVDRISDFRRACKGFTINGVRYERLLGTTGGVKVSTVVFVSSALAPELRRKINNGRDLEKKFVPAKLEAYRALTCSASVPVSFPKGILVVPDVTVSFEDDVINLSSSGDGEPKMSPVTRQEITLTPSDGCGMMSPDLAKRWSDETSLGYLMSGCCCRCAFTKGMLFTFPFHEFADSVGKYVVKDAWGNDVDVRDVELVLTTSMLKLWDSYGSIEEYLENCHENKYTFGITKACPEILESERATNYQFLQSFNLSDEDVEELIAPTVQEFHDVLGGDWRKTVLFLAGTGLTESNVCKLPDDYIKAMMIHSGVANDPYVMKCVYRLIKKKIDEAKVGVIKVHGNYSMMSGDLYLLCQSVFGEPLTGILGAGEIYNEYWADSDADAGLGFRAPMSVHSNIRRLTPSRREEVRHWFRYMHTCTVMSAWSNEMNAMNGADFDGDLIFLTDNPVLLRRHEVQPVLMCEQHSSNKIVPSEADLIESNIASFGNEVGTITNRVTSMYEIQSQCPEDSAEYAELAYRIKCGQQQQQDSIDKAKGIQSKPMPKAWYDRHSIVSNVPEHKQQLYKNIVADHKPYFMIYIYPALHKQYREYVKRANKNCLREFDLTLDELLARSANTLTDRQLEFVQYYKRNLPVGVGECVVNRICKKIEEKFDGIVSRLSSASTFDYTIYKSGVEYSYSRMSEIRSLIKDYERRVQSYCLFAQYERIDKDEIAGELSVIEDDFREHCNKICPNSEELGDIIIDLCYKAEKSKRFAWKVCGSQIITNLANKYEKISIPVESDAGSISFGSKKFEVIVCEYKGVI